MSTFFWQCPSCGRNATIGEQNHRASSYHFPIENDQGRVSSLVEFTVCPNPECKSLSFSAHLHKTGNVNGVNPYSLGRLIQSWSLIPVSNAKLYPEYVPEPIRNDYTEACAIKELSPKSSATLARRTLQGMIRDFWAIKKPNLKQAIEAVKEKVDPLVWEAIDGVRKIGNIGAHMEDDINLIVEVEPEEAEKLIWLIEFLVDDWYVARHNRQEGLKAVVDLADVKENERHGEEQA